MKNYSDLRVTSILVCIELSLINNPKYAVAINGINKPGTTISHWVDILQPFTITVELLDKNYLGPETAVVIDSITVDGISVIPEYTHLAQYTNDHNNNNPTAYLGFIGKWTLTFDSPFYQWLHQATGQGWLLKPY